MDCAVGPQRSCGPRNPMRSTMDCVTRLGHTYMQAHLGLGRAHTCACLDLTACSWPTAHACMCPSWPTSLPCLGRARALLGRAYGLGPLILLLACTLRASLFCTLHAPSLYIFEILATCSLSWTSVHLDFYSCRSNSRCQISTISIST